MGVKTSPIPKYQNIWGDIWTYSFRFLTEVDRWWKQLGLDHYFSPKKLNEDKEVRGRERDKQKRREGEITSFLRKIDGAIWRSHPPTCSKPINYRKLSADRDGGGGGFCRSDRNRREEVGAPPPPTSLAIFLVQNEYLGHWIHLRVCRRIFNWIYLPFDPWRGLISYQCRVGALTSPFPTSVIHTDAAPRVMRENNGTAQTLKGQLAGSSFIFRRNLLFIAVQVCDRGRDIPILMAAVCPNAFSKAALKERSPRRSVFATKLSKGAVAGCRATPPPLWITEPWYTTSRDFGIIGSICLLYIVCCPTLPGWDQNRDRDGDWWFEGRRVGFGAIFPFTLTLKPPI